jgi:hypothetical protein
VKTTAIILGSLPLLWGAAFLVDAAARLPLLVVTPVALCGLAVLFLSMWSVKR